MLTVIMIPYPTVCPAVLHAFFAENKPQIYLFFSGNILFNIKATLLIILLRVHKLSPAQLTLIYYFYIFFKIK